MSHDEIRELGLFLTGLIALPLFPLMLLTIWFEWPRKVIAGFGFLFLLLHLICPLVSRQLLYGTHFNEKGLMLDGSGAKFSDGCLVDGFTLAVHRSGFEREINIGIPLLIVTLLVTYAWVLGRKKRRVRVLVEAAHQADEGEDLSEHGSTYGQEVPWLR